ncbi:hypothetical protein [Propionivibrio sp.]|nr:hypothetical protein [Propionivibrio sp.]
MNLNKARETYFHRAKNIEEKIERCFLPDHPLYLVEINLNNKA